jgi:hypothetical protein
MHIRFSLEIQVFVFFFGGCVDVKNEVDSKEFVVNYNKGVAMLGFFSIKCKR